MKIINTLCDMLPGLLQFAYIGFLLGGLLYIIVSLNQFFVQERQRKANLSTPIVFIKPVNQPQ